MSLPTVLFLGLVGLIVLLAAVMLVVLIVTRRKPNSVEVPLDPDPQPDADSQPDPTAPPAVTPPDTPPDLFTPIGSLHRDRRTGELVLERQGRFYRSADQLTGSERSELETAARDLLTWLDLTPKAAPEKPAVERPIVPPPAPPAIRPEPVNRPAAAGSIVAQVDEILQEMLATSEHANRSIHLSERPECGVLVWIGAQRYEGIDAVPDEDVKSILRAAVKEWERRQTL